MGTPIIASQIDHRFQWRREETKLTRTASPGVKFYQKVLSQTLGSECRWLPSDSQYAQRLAGKCGGLKAIPLSMARFMLEPEAAQIAQEIFYEKGRLRFYDPIDSCSFF